ncbi:hypothetical protein J2S59_002703 [Nocardioides massiliensis]|uniref:Aspartate kinase n=2 Tax=Nocardioides massiliensis TaxID=1325935 RepID=A0ABT9NR40_9ACTN|nr:ACT domain-containing protein [Nocardioides massiliensis]MDP9822894.1 hypothetical protein [Nocardioides massiliensis]
MRLAVYPETLAVVRLGPGAEVPSWAESSSVFSVTATATETSVVCAARSVPGKARALKPLTAFAVEGAPEVTTSGVLVELLTPLAEEGISAFPVPTHDTLWILVAVDDAERAGEAWRRSGHEVAPAVPVTPGSSPKPAGRPEKSTR